ncbi:nuclear receptor subfamily 0, group B, member 2b [Danio rerio]|uniref:Nuclear receptor subfamily 0, group B, member 2b n=1 Tax=Danio rerio TaxID=7955 RepID=A0AB13A8L2_DANRE|nr:nuclear receptor subfamily 0, group B, member 2b [Danio rerio]|eukprot:XP_001338278.1 nuclear receptor subfamily 0 group B member 2 [Danio rerio]
MRKHLHPHGILFNILTRKPEFAYFTSPEPCHCNFECFVSLKNPEITCPAAFQVLTKSIHFMQSSLSHQNLSSSERLCLLQKRWVPLFILGLAQENISFEVMDFPVGSILRNILLSGQQKPDDCPLTLAKVNKLKMFLDKVWSLQLSLKEYACLKGAILFSQVLDSPGLKSSLVIAGLQEEFAHDLHMLILSRQRSEEHWTIMDVLFTACTLQMEARSMVTELFFRPIMGKMDIQELLNEIINNNVGL